MRSLTPDEIDMVAGGDIVVNAPVYRDLSTGLIYGGQAPPESNHTVNGQDFQSYYHKYDLPPVHNEHDLGSKLHVKGGDINLDQVYEATVNLGGHNVKVIYDNTTMTANDLKMASDVVQALSNAYSKLDAGAKQALGSLQNIVFTAQGDRSFSQEDQHTFVVGVDSELEHQTEWFTETDVIHDAEHIYLWDQTHDLNQSRGVAAEKQAIDLQISNAAVLGLTKGEIDGLKAFRADDDAILARVNSQP